MPFQPGNTFSKGRPAGALTKHRTGACHAWCRRFGQKFLEDVAEGKPVFERKIVTIVKAKNPGEQDVVKELTIMESADPRVRVDVAFYLSDCAYGKPAQMLGVDPETADELSGVLERASKRAALEAAAIEASKQLPET